MEFNKQQIELGVWRSDLHEEMTQLTDLGISIPEFAYTMCFLVNKKDYEGLNNSETVDLIIQQAQVIL